MTRYVMLVVALVLLSACRDEVRIVGHCDDEPVLWPDYKDVTVPCNIAPLCFSVAESDAAVIIRGREDSIMMTTRDGSFNPPSRAWHALLNKERGHSLTVTVCRASEYGWMAMRPFKLHVSADSIDAWLVYRRITPGYGLWNRMGIFQRCLESYDENAIYENREGQGNCANCHTFCQGQPDRWQLHVRMRYGGTYIFDGDKQTLLPQKGDGKPAYAAWHPSGELMAYSSNSTFFFIHTRKSNRWEVMDDESDVFVADVRTGEQFRSPLTSSAGSFETFPCFSPCGRWLYFCTAPATDRVVEEYDSLRYSICRIAFDAETRSFGSSVDTVYNAVRDGGSASFPRISPDGRWLCFTRSGYGNFSICHRDADLCLIDLRDSLRTVQVLNEANSTQVDSWHSWSRNSRWIVFSSKRDDGMYTRPYFTHIDSCGQASKPFLLPQRDAQNHYDLDMDCYNLPELVRGRITTNRIKLTKRTATDKQDGATGIN